MRVCVYSVVIALIIQKETKKTRQLKLLDACKFEPVKLVDLAPSCYMCNYKQQQQQKQKYRKARARCPAPAAKLEQSHGHHL